MSQRHDYLPPTFPALDNFCGKYLKFRDLIECGETWERYRTDNRPSRIETYQAMHELCAHVVDPLIERFGRPELHYAFASPALDRLVRLKAYPRTSRHLDQHAGCELNRDGKPYCTRLGLAVDLRVPGVSSLDVARWVVANTTFDRLYFYGAHRPFHVSVGPENSRATWRFPASSSSAAPSVNLGKDDRNEQDNCSCRDA